MRKLLIVGILVLAALLTGSLLWRLAQRPPRALNGDNMALHPQPVATKAAVQVVDSARTAPVLVLPPGMTNPGWADKRDMALKYRLTNTSRPMSELVGSDRAILLENALIEIGRPVDLGIPERLRAGAEPGAYIVQSRGELTDRFRALLNGAGAKVVSYIPNNAYLVRASAGAARGLAGLAEVQAVLALEPYYKLKPALLEAVLENKAPEPDALFKLMIFADARQGTIEALQGLEGEVVGESPSPFGPVLTVRGLADVAAAAALPGVACVQMSSPRSVGNDLLRATTTVATNSVAPDNYLGLTGTNVLVDVSDTGVDEEHPDLTGRVTGDALTDLDGHGTHVAGTIASSGSQSTTVTNAGGSVKPPVDKQFRGMAPQAQVYAQGALVFPEPTDYELQSRAALTNALISNNSWHYAEQSYDIAAASYDAAVRDALPQDTGSQPVLFVFSAGNDGGGDESGGGGLAGTIESPATAKNIITVGAVEQLRGITNETHIIRDGETNTSQPWILMTDSSRQVASFSARGNVGIGVEGEFGRFKPDVVAPGTFVVSTRSGQWDEGAYYNPTNYHYFVNEDQVVETNTINQYPLFTFYNTVGMIITVSEVVPTNVTQMPIYADEMNVATTFIGYNQVSVPDPTPSSDWNYGVGNPTNVAVHYDVTATLVTTNDNGDYLTVLSNLNNTLGPYYRYESGTSMSAAGVSGMLALMGDFFTNVLEQVPSPALLKAMLINGARSADVQYDLQVQNNKNFQGWGLVNLTNSLPGGLTGGLNQAGGSPMLVFEQDPTNGLATGERSTIELSVDEAAQSEPLRVTLVWTDPPGNPMAGIKLVNDLDLVVTNLDTGEVFIGNDIGIDANFNSAWPTNLTPHWDRINNVENVYLGRAGATNLSVTVLGYRVNVNALSAHTNNVVQDFALVISSGNGQNTNALKIEVPAEAVRVEAADVTTITNDFADIPEARISGQLLTHQRVGADSPLIGLTQVPVPAGAYLGTNGAITLGVSNQWHFYVFANNPTNAYTNAAIATFMSPTLAVPRMGVTNVEDPEDASRIEADIELYVSTDPGLLTLDAAAVAAADKSLSRGGTELIVYSNAAPDTVYYIGVKAEDRHAAEYALFAVFSELPFSATDADGNVIVRGLNVPAVIPGGGQPSDPEIVRVLGIAVQPLTVRRVVVSETLTHQNMADLVGTLRHGQMSAVLHNHPDEGEVLSQTFVYEDNGENDILGSIHSDGPPSLLPFMGEPGQGIWILTELANAPNRTGVVENVTIRLEPQDLDNGILLKIAPNSFAFAAIDVPPEATNMTIQVVNESDEPLPVELYVRRGDLPSRTVYDYMANIPPTGGGLSISTSDLPPLAAGRWYLGVYNPNDISQTVRVFVTFDLDVDGIQPLKFPSAGPEALPDDAVSYSSIVITNDARIVRAEVGVMIDHPRLSDLSLTLISPAGKRILLMENRGGTTPYGAGTQNLDTNIIATAMADGFENMGHGTYYSGAQVKGWHVDAGSVDVHGLPTMQTHSGNNLLDINGWYETGTISSNFVTIPGQAYRLNIWHTRNIGGDVSVPAEARVSQNGLTLMNLVDGRTNLSWLDLQWQPTSTVFVASSTLTKLQFEGVSTGAYGILLDDISVEQLPEPFEYLVFTENTNTAKLPIKFAVPPFKGTNWAATNSIAGFESIPPSDYASASVVDGWTVAENQVSVVSDPANSQQGSRFMALAKGGITRVLSTTPGSQYNFSLGYRGPGAVSFWRGEGNTFDSVDANHAVAYNGATFGPSLVGQAMLFNTLNPRFEMGDPVNLRLTNSFTIDTWIFPFRLPSAFIHAEILFRGDMRDSLDPYYVAMRQAGGIRLHIENSTGGSANVDSAPITTNQWHHISGVLDGNTGRLALYIDGVLAGETITTIRPFRDLNGSYSPGVAIGNHSGGVYNHQFDGLIDEMTVYNRALSYSEVLAICLATNAGKIDTNAPVPARDALAKAEIVLGTVTNTLYGENASWTVTNLSFIATQTATPVSITGLQPGMLLDSLGSTELGAGLFYFPEETLDALIGDNCQGEWKLEIWDNRAGVVGTLSSWQMRLILETNTPTPTPLFNGVAVTNSIPPCWLKVFYVDVPPWVAYVTNTLIYATLPVNVWFNQDGAPSTNVGPGNYEMLASSLGGAFTLFTNGPLPNLVPNARYYLGVQNPCGNPTNAEFAIRVDFGLDAVRLTNGVPYTNSSDGVTQTFQYYVYNVSSNAVRAQFEIISPSGSMALVARKGLPPPTEHDFDYLSDNAGLNDELIVVFTNSAPVPLGAGDWYLTALNLSGRLVAYTIMATEWAETGRPFAITNWSVTSNSFCITWNSLPGVHYYVQGVTNLGDGWFTISPTITATNTWTTYCIGLPTPYQFFRVAEGLALLDYQPPAITIVQATNGFVVEWVSRTNYAFGVDWAGAVDPPVSWASFTNVITSTNGYFWFLDDGTQTGGFGPSRFYRVLILP